MSLGYDIFRQMEDGPLWIAQVTTLGEANAKLEILHQMTPGQYFLREAATGKVVAELGGKSSDQGGKSPGQAK